MKNTLLLLTLLITLTSAFDGNRRGFILGGGAGLHLMPCKESISSDSINDIWYRPSSVFPKRYNDEVVPSFGVSTDFILGGGITPQIMVYYENSVSFSFYHLTWEDEPETHLNADGEEVLSQSGGGSNGIFVNGATMIGGRYYFSPQERSLFVTGSLGTAVTIDPGNFSHIGPGFTLGGGYEFKKHRHVEFKYLHGKTAEKSDEVAHRFNSFQILFTALAF